MKLMWIINKIIITMLLNHKYSERALKKKNSGVSFVAQWLTNLTRNHDVAGWTPGLAQWVKDPAGPLALLSGLRIQRCCEL